MPQEAGVAGEAVEGGVGDAVVRHGFEAEEGDEGGHDGEAGVLQGGGADGFEAGPNADGEHEGRGPEGPTHVGQVRAAD